MAAKCEVGVPGVTRGMAALALAAAGCALGARGEPDWALAATACLGAGGLWCGGRWLEQRLRQAQGSADLDEADVLRE